MLDDKEVLIQFDHYGILNAVKYVRTESGLELKKCKEYVERLVSLRANFDPTKGTITWFECTKLLPKKDNRFSYSDNVIVTDKVNIQIGSYCHNPAQGDPYWHIHGDWTPSHWAFINFPES